MNSKPKDISPGDLEEIMRDALKSRNAPPDYIAGYIDAQKRSGFLKPKAPAWIRNTAALYYLLPPPGEHFPSLTTKEEA